MTSLASRHSQWEGLASNHSKSGSRLKILARRFQQIQMCKQQHQRIWWTTSGQLRVPLLSSHSLKQSSKTTMIRLLDAEPLALSWKGKRQRKQSANLLWWIKPTIEQVEAAREAKTHKLFLQIKRQIPRSNLTNLDQWCQVRVQDWRALQSEPKNLKTIEEKRNSCPKQPIARVQIAPAKWFHRLWEPRQTTEKSKQSIKQMPELRSEPKSLRTIAGKRSSCPKQPIALNKVEVKSWFHHLWNQLQQQRWWTMKMRVLNETYVILLFL